MDKKIAIVYGNSVNQVTVPITAFHTFDKAKETITKLLGREPDQTQDNGCLWRVDWETSYCDREDLNEKNMQEAKKFFASYYNGCGGVSSVAIQELNEGEMGLFPFSLD